MKAFKIEARAINAVTKMMAEKEGVNIWRQVQVQVSVLLVSPEMLSTPGFENLLQEKLFKQLVLESPVQSGFLAQKNKTETETGPDVS